MGRSPVLPQKPPPIPDWSAKSCMQGGQARSILSAANDRPPYYRTTFSTKNSIDTTKRGLLAWWAEFLTQWNGISFPQPLNRNHLTMTSDASGTWGCGAWHNTSWFQIRWDATAHPLTIAEKELIPIIIGCAVWGGSWEGHRVTCFCDNQVVVATLSSKTSKHPGLMHLIRCLAFVEAKLNFTLQPRYINTRANFLADDLSRDNHASFSQKAPHMDKNPTRTSTHLLQLLLEHTADWTSQRWRPQFSDIFRQA